jgi:hypothetical protein
MKKKKICAEVYFLPSHCSDYWLGSELCLSFPITIPDIDCDDRRWRSEQTKTHIEQSVQLLKRTQINEKKNCNINIPGLGLAGGFVRRWRAMEKAEEE